MATAITIPETAIHISMHIHSRAEFELEKGKEIDKIHLCIAVGKSIEPYSTSVPVMLVLQMEQEEACDKAPRGTSM